MTAPIVDLLTACGVSLPTDGTAWQRLVLIDNRRPIPTDHGSDDVTIGYGFNVLVVDANGLPTHFSKWRPTNPGGPNPASLAARLSRSPDLAMIIPETRNIETSEISGQVSRYLHGELLEHFLRTMTTDEMGVALVEILDAAGRVSESAAELEPSMLEGSPSLRFRDAAAWGLDTLCRAGVGEDSLSTLSAALIRAGDVRRVLQHGDIWMRNVLRVDDRWWILDFDSYGLIQVPLYDALHLARTTWEARPSWRTAGTGWIDDLRGDQPEVAAYKKAVAHVAHRYGLTRAQVGGALLHYTVDMGARLYARRLHRSDGVPYLSDIHRLAEWVASGQSAEDLIC
jgi:hypothetical protein